MRRSSAHAELACHWHSGAGASGHGSAAQDGHSHCVGACEEAPSDWLPVIRTLQRARPLRRLRAGAQALASAEAAEKGEEALTLTSPGASLFITPFTFGKPLPPAAAPPCFLCLRVGWLDAVGGTFLSAGAGRGGTRCVAGRRVPSR
jgi:hypothetical protein